MKTSFYSLLCIVIRTVALATLLVTLVGLPSQFVYFAAVPTPGSFVATAIAGQGATIAICFALWMFPGALARLAVTHAAREPFESSIDAADLQRIGFGIVGVWLVYKGIEAALYAFGQYLAIRYEFKDISIAAGQPLPWLDMSVGIATIVAGLALTLGSRGLARFLHALRYGSPAPRPSEEAR